MNKKSYISLLFLVAFAVLFMHSITPHHHDEEKAAQHSGKDDDDHDGYDHNPLSHAFGSFHHDKAGIVIYESASPTYQCSKIAIDRAAVLFTQYVIRQLLKPPIIHGEHFSYAFTPINYSASSLFRGPPMA